jgi:hypothetical protein
MLVGEQKPKENKTYKRKTIKRMGHHSSGRQTEERRGTMKATGNKP